MEFKEAMRIWKRMCKAMGDGCEGCPMCGQGACGSTPDTQDESLIEDILTKWAEEHPVKTRMDDFLDKHPKASLDDNDTPRACAKHLGYCAECLSSNGAADCDDCWRRPLEEVE